MRPVHRILFVRTDRMGDVLMNLPALQVLRRSYPKAWISLVVDRKVAGLFREHPDLDEVIAVDAAELERSGTKRRKVVREIRKARFDMGIVSNPSKFFHWLLFSAGIPVRVGWRRKWPFLLSRSLPDTKSQMTRHEIDANLALAGLVSTKKWDGVIRMAVNLKASEKIEGLLRPLDKVFPIVAVHAGSSNPQKIWPNERFAELCRRLLSSGRGHLVLIGGEEEMPISQKIAAQISGSCLDLTGRLTLEELAAFFKHPQVRTLVSSDSGPVHVAWMSGKPVVAFYAKNAVGSDPARWGPRDGKSKVLFKSMDEITVDEVWEDVQSII